MASRKPKPKNLPLRQEVGPPIGSGQDNAVYDLLHPAEKPHLRVPTGWVVKVDHELDDVARTIRNRHEDPREAAWRGTQYKKHKYDILKHFLGNVIPDSAFVMTEAARKDGRRYVEMTLQQKVPKYTLGDLTPEQRRDPRLVQNMSRLVHNMQYMYGVLGEVNARTASHVNLDAKLDLGGVSDYVRAERLDHEFNPDQIQGILDTNKSPNLLVDPDTMHMYCIDFDQGQWVDGMSDAKELAFEIDAHNRQHERAGQAATALVAHAPSH